jgi:hypothetical protein
MSAFMAYGIGYGIGFTFPLFLVGLIIRIIKMIK